jgi:hypothetical protein
MLQLPVMCSKSQKIREVKIEVDKAVSPERFLEKPCIGNLDIWFYANLLEL